ncbi:hypothetical protein ACVXZ4_08330 [Lacisediminihabitans sp. FW035]
MLFAKAIAALLIAGGMLAGGSAAFADTAAAPVFDHQVKIADGFYLVSVRSAASSRADEIGDLKWGQEYLASGTAVHGPASIYGGAWIPVRFEGHTAFVNAGMVTETAQPVAKAAPAKSAKPAAAAPAPAITAAAAGQVTISTNIIWLALTGLLTLAVAAVSYFIPRPIVQVSAAGIAAAAAIATAFIRPAGSGLLTAVPALAVALITAAAVFIAILRRFDSERPSMQILRPAFRDWKVTAPLAASALALAIVLAALGQPLLVSAAAVLIAAAGVAAWRLAAFTNTDRPQPTQIEPGEYRPRGFTLPTGGNLS